MACWYFDAIHNSTSASPGLNIVLKLDYSILLPAGLPFPHALMIKIMSHSHLQSVCHSMGGDPKELFSYILTLIMHVVEDHGHVKTPVLLGG